MIELQSLADEAAVAAGIYPMRGNGPSIVRRLTEGECQIIRQTGMYAMELRDCPFLNWESLGGFP